MLFKIPLPSPSGTLCLTLCFQLQSPNHPPQRDSPCMIYSRTIPDRISNLHRLLLKDLDQRWPEFRKETGQATAAPSKDRSVTDSRNTGRFDVIPAIEHLNQFFPPESFEGGKNCF